MKYKCISNSTLLLDGTYEGSNFITTPALVRKKILFDLYNISIRVHIYRLKRNDF